MRAGVDEPQDRVRSDKSGRDAGDKPNHCVDRSDAMADDHKATFRLGGSPPRSPVSYDVRDLVAALPGNEPISMARQDAGYIYAFRRRGGTDKARLRRALKRILQSLHRHGLAPRWLEVFSFGVATLCGCPIDQTSQVTIDGALAQIEVIVRKRDDRIASV